MAQSQSNKAETLSDLYLDLNLNTADSFRILDLLPGNRAAELRISLHVVALSSLPQYEALSYTWGASNEEHSVLVNHKYRVPITDNLFRALRGLRSHFKSRSMWVDAISINQSDLVERGQQVKMMGRIYQSASCVDVWLGESSLLAKGLTPPKNMDHGAKHLHDTWELPLSQALKDPRAIRSFIQAKQSELDGALESNQPLWDSRAWTIQESMLAKRLFLCFGKHRILFQPQSVRALATESLTPLTQRLVISLTNRMALMERKMPGTLTILDIMHILVNAGATDPRDIVYCVLGMITPEERDLVNVDYTLPCLKVYAKATFASIISSGSFEILCHVKGGPKAGEGLPTWCVDFSSLSHLPDNVRATHEDIKSLSTWGNEITFGWVFSRFRPTLDASHKYLSFQGEKCNAFVKTKSLRFPGSTVGKKIILNSITSFVASAGSCAAELLQRTKENYDASPLYVKMLHTLMHIPTQEGAALNRSLLTDIATRNTVPNETILGDPFVSTRQAVCESFREWDRSISLHSSDITAASNESLNIESSHISAFWDYASAASDEPVLFMTDTGTIGLAPCHVASGDILVLARNPWPFMILRRRDERFEFCGFGYVHGFMHRTFWDDWSKNGFKDESREQTFVLQ